MLLGGHDGRVYLRELGARSNDPCLGRICDGFLLSGDSLLNVSTFLGSVCASLGSFDTDVCRVTAGIR